MAEAITVEEWLAELERLQQKAGVPQDGEYTTVELSQQTGKNKRWVLERLAEAKATGRLAVGRRRVECVDGRMGWVGTYRLLRHNVGEGQVNDAEADRAASGSGGAPSVRFQSLGPSQRATFGHPERAD